MDESKKPQGSIPLPSSKKGPRAFFRDVRLEMKHVTWPSLSETNRLVWHVLGVCGLVTLMLWVFSTALDAVIGKLITGGK